MLIFLGSSRRELGWAGVEYRGCLYVDLIILRRVVRGER